MGDFICSMLIFQGVLINLSVGHLWVFSTTDPIHRKSRFETSKGPTRIRSRLHVPWQQMRFSHWHIANQDHLNFGIRWGGEGIYGWPSKNKGVVKNPPKSSMNFHRVLEPFFSPSILGYIPLFLETPIIFTPPEKLTWLAGKNNKHFPCEKLGDVKMPAIQFVSLLECLWNSHERNGGYFYQRSYFQLHTWCFCKRKKVSWNLVFQRPAFWGLHSFSATPTWKERYL